MIKDTKGDDKPRTEIPDLSGDEGFFARMARPQLRGKSYGGTGGMVEGKPLETVARLRLEAFRKGL